MWTILTRAILSSFTKLDVNGGTSQEIELRRNLREAGWLRPHFVILPGEMASFTVIVVYRKISYV
jgi:hypothetical protein